MYNFIISSFTPCRFQLFVVPSIVLYNWNTEFQAIFNSDFYSKHLDLISIDMFLAYITQPKVQGNLLRLSLIECLNHKALSSTLELERLEQTCIFMFIFLQSFNSQVLSMFEYNEYVVESGKKKRQLKKK